MPKFVPRERKHKIRERTESNGGKRGEGVELQNSNVTAILPRTITEKEQRRQDLRADLRAQQPRISGKKQKRLDKYIDKKLQKEENLDFIRKLANAKIDTSLLQSSRSFGGQKPKRHLLTQALKETRAGINVDSNRELLFENQSDESSVSEDSDEPGKSHPPDPPLRKPDLPAFGSGLKRSLEPSQDGIPAIKRRVRLNKVKPIFRPESEPSWDGFSSEEGSRHAPSLASSLSPSPCAQYDSEGASTDNSDASTETSEDAITNDEVDGVNQDEKEERKGRSSAFKAWATQQVNESLGFVPTGVSNDMSEDPKSSDQKYLKQPTLEPRPLEQEPLPPELHVSSNAPDRQVYHVNIVRSPEIEQARLALPVVAEEQKIMEAIHNNPTVVIWGATGSGKTTQIPQFLYEAGYGSRDSSNSGIIGVTQPRRVAAVSMAKRVADELGQERDKVSYQIRFDSSVSNKTCIKFMTDGILIREIADDFALLKYSVIIIDEAHERSANTDILIGMVSRIVDLRASMSKEDKTVKPLKLIIMSATLRVTDFLDNPTLFRNGAPPLIQAEGRQFPVTAHFARRTERDYVEEVFTKICRGHKKLPPGGMLIFLTSQGEITTLAKRLKEALGNNQGLHLASHKVHVSADKLPLETEDLDIGNEQDQSTAFDEEAEDDDDVLINDEENHEFNVEDTTPASSDVHILPLYSQLQTKDQLRVFEPPPEKARMIVLATNVAETSLTIPDIRYVFDTGRAKEKKYDRLTGVQTFDVGWISKASASQRAGRAGRTGPGHCYRLYSSAVYERDFKEHAEPEILRMPVEGVVLQLKSMDLQHVINFPFPTPPDRQSLAKAEKLLSYLGALSSEGKITTIGRQLPLYPLSPRFAKMLTIGHQHNCMPYTIALVAALATPNLFIPENQIFPPTPAPEPTDIYTTSDRLVDESHTQFHKSYNQAHHLLSRHSPSSDALKALTALCASAHAPFKDQFCQEMFLSPKSLSEAVNLNYQLTSIVRNLNPTLLPSPIPIQLPSPSKHQLSALQQITAAAFIDQIAIIHSAHPSPPSLLKKPTRPIDVPYFPLFPINRRRSTDPDTDIIDTAIFIHPSSVLAHLAVKDLPTYIIYAHLQRGTPATVAGKKPRTRMHALGAVGGREIAGLARGTVLLRYGKPVGKVEEMGEGGKRRKCWVVPFLVGEKGGTEWPLPAEKVVQRKGERGEWVVERIIG